MQDAALAADHDWPRTVAYACGNPAMVRAARDRLCAAGLPPELAMLCGVVSYMLMNFMMTSAPLAMEPCGLPREYSNYGIELHVVAMYLPSFFTGRLIARFGETPIVLAGLALTAAAALVGMSGQTVAHFW